MSRMRGYGRAGGGIATGTAGGAVSEAEFDALANTVEDLSDTVDVLTSEVLGTSRTIVGATILNGSKIVNTATAQFTEADEGQRLIIPGAGPAGAPLIGIIFSVITTSQISLNPTTASTSVTDTVALLGLPIPPEGDSVALTPDDSTLEAAQFNSALLTAWVTDDTRADSAFRITTAGKYYIYGEFDITNADNWVTEVELGGGVEIIQTIAAVNTATRGAGLAATGSLENVAGEYVVRYFTVNADRNDMTITLDSVSGLIGEGHDEPGSGANTAQLGAGSMLFLRSDDGILAAGGKYRACALRRVVTIVGSVVTLDAPLFRDMTTANHACAIVVNPHPALLVHGAGRIYHNDPWACTTFFAPVTRFEFVENLTMRDLTLGPGPGVGVALQNVWGADVAVHTQYLLSDDLTGTAPQYITANTRHEDYFGYGVSAGGATRQYRIGGTAHHIRHAFTTGACTDGRHVAALKTQMIADHADTTTQPQNDGDPEFGYVAIRVWNSWQQAIDTHEAGHDLIIDVSHVGVGTWDDSVEEAQQASVNLRNTNVTVMGMADGGVVEGLIIDESTLAHPEWGTITLRDFSIGSGPEGIRYKPGDGSRLRLDNVYAHDAIWFIYLRGSADGWTITGEGNRCDGEDAVVWVQGGTTPLGNIDIGVDYSSDVEPVHYADSTITQDRIRLRKTTDRRQIVIVYNGVAWPTARPICPAGDLLLVSATPAITAPAWLLSGDRYDVAAV